MNILILTNKMPYPPTDGGAIATLAMIEGFEKVGHSVTVFAMNTYKHSFEIDDLPDNLKNKINWNTCYVDTAIKPPEMLYNLIFSAIPYNAKRFISNIYRSRLVALLQEKSYDIIQLEGLYLYPYITTIRKNSKALIALRAHNVEQEIWKRTVRNQTPGIKRIYNRVLSMRMQRMEKRSLTKVDLLVPITERDGYILDFIGNQSPVYVAPIGVDIDKMLPTQDLELTNHNSIYFIGSLDWSPNQEGILWFVDKIWNNILKEYPEAMFHIAGRNAPVSFKHKINKKNIQFHGQVDDAKAFALKHNIMVSPLLTGSGMRVKLVEAMALQKPIVSTRIGAEGIPVVNHTHMMLADKERDFADAIVDLLKSPEKCKNIGNNARALIEKQFDNEVIINGLLKFYEVNLERL
ncbi:MAG: glycosyltransferase family 4 protein [Salinivirgaceae bacterium]|nr:glycosyltransferase family 4 protein [Salinivirgaceae bacterium]MDD4746877.1 glycosyltransferase family 4 protein [Salinivirgaceae bacterium]MDY0279402.1 glycosyltransferase family 4 protein [Salinivirgaceae bacterium]